MSRVFNLTIDTSGDYASPEHTDSLEEPVVPVTRLERFLSKIAGSEDDIEPRNRVEYYLDRIADYADDEMRDAVSDWLDENISSDTSPMVDTSLSIRGAAADAKAVGDAISAEASARDAAIANNVDETLSVSGKAADSKATGFSISKITGQMPVVWTSGYIPIGAAGNTVNITSVTASNTMVCVVLEVVPGDIISLTLLGGGTNSSGARAFGILDSDKKVLLQADKNLELNDSELVMPDSAAYLVLNSKNTVAYYAIPGKRLCVQVDELEQTLGRIATYENYSGVGKKWVNYSVSSSGVTSASSYTLLSPFIEKGDFENVSFTGASTLDGAVCFTYVCEYSSANNSAFLRRTTFTGRSKIVFGTDCTHIRFLYGHSTSTGVAMPTSNGAYFSALLYTNEVENLTEQIEAARIGLHVVPPDTGTLNVIKRCRQLTDVKWTPAVDLPRLELVQRTRPYPEGCESEYRLNTFKAGVEYTGIPYGRAYGYSPALRPSGNLRTATTFVGVDTDIETFVSSAQNKDSFLCNANIGSVASHFSVPYALVCSAFASYALGINLTTTSGIPNVTGMSSVGRVDDNGTQLDLKKLKLGDVLDYGTDEGGHAAVITDIIHDSTGEVVAVEISEATSSGNANPDVQGGQQGGLCRRMGWTAADLYTYWGGYTVYRYGGIAGVTYTPNAFSPVCGEFASYRRVADRPCMPYEGEKFRYVTGYIPNNAIKILVSCSGYSSLRVFKDGEEIAASPYTVTNETEYVSVETIDAGNYSAYLCNIENNVVKQLTATCHWKIE